MDGSDDLIKYISQKFEVTPEIDGSYVVHDDKNTYLITLIKSSTKPSHSAIIPIYDETTTSEESLILHPKVGKNDKEPDFDATIKKKDPIQGMFPSFEKNQKKPLLQFDPTCPGKKNKKKWPEPDPDNFDPGKNLDEFD